MREFRTIIRNWEDATELGRFYRTAGDEARFDLGDLACFACSRKNGRPPTLTDYKTLGQLADEIGEYRSALSQMASMSEFLSSDDDRQTCYEKGAGWHTMNAARIRTGWKPGEAVTEKQSALFWDIVTKAADDDAMDTLSPLAREVEWLRNEHARLGRRGAREGLPDAVYHALADAQAALAIGLAALEIMRGHGLAMLRQDN